MNKWTVKKYVDVNNLKKIMYCIMCDENEVAIISGPMSLAVAFLAVRELNKDKVLKDGWVDEVMNFFKKG